MTAHKFLIIAASTIAMALPACGGAGWEPETPKSTAEPTAFERSVETVGEFEQRDPSLKQFFEQAHAYAVYPSVGKGGAVLGGAYGRGQVYRNGQLIGSTAVTQVTAGFQLGGQSYSEVIFFEDEAALAEFTDGTFEFSSQASAVAVTAGAAANSSYDDGVAVFTCPKGGVMYEASVAGQSFSFDPIRSKS